MEWLQRLRVKAAADPVDATLVAMRVCGVVALLMIVAVAVWLVVEPLVIGPLPAPPPPPPIPPWFRGEVEPWGLDDYAGAVVALVWTAVAITRFGRSRWGDVLGIAVLMAATQVDFWLLRDLLHLVVPPDIPVFSDVDFPSPGAVIPLVFLAIMVAAAVFLVAVIGGRLIRDEGRRERWRRRSQIVMTVILLLPYAWPALYFLHRNPLGALASVPSTALALWVVARLQRHRQLPAGVILAAFGWGVFMSGYGIAMNLHWMEVAPSIAPNITVVQLGLPLHAGIFEELGKAAGVAMLCILAARWVDSIVSGLVLGAAVGLGFNFIESVEFMATDAPLHFWLRQTVGIMAAHTAFSALAGAGFGVARQLQRRRDRVVAVGSGLLAAMTGHTLTNYGLARVQPLLLRNLEDGVVIALVALPLLMLLLQWPFVAMALWLWRLGLRVQYDGLLPQLALEAATGRGAVTDSEVTALLEPAEVRRRALQALREHGLHGYVLVTMLRGAQLDLAMHWWHRSRGDLREQDGTEEELLDRIAELRAEADALEERPESTRVEELV